MGVFNSPTLQSERLILRKFEKSDIEALFLLLQDEEVNTFLPWFPRARRGTPRKFTNGNLRVFIGRNKDMPMPFA